ncbi:MAG: hypothetical protein LUQ31_03135 [Methanoregula sp.]|nr:hypothetical protein [Methanoregula sp.]
MTSRHFGDTRDLFKFDLVRHIMKSLPTLGTFTFVPMLTREITPGKKSPVQTDLMSAVKGGKAGSQNRELREHMQRLQEITDDLDYVSGIRAYFTNEDIRIDILGEERFNGNNRDTYFRSLLENFPKSSLIFLDPDVGLEENREDPKHLLLSEVKTIYDDMDSASILMLYQHFPRSKCKDYTKNRCRQLEDLTGTAPVTITDNEIVFFLLAKNGKLADQLDRVVGRYADTYPALISSCSDE